MPHERNAGMPLDLAWVHAATVNMPALLRRTETHLTRRSVKVSSSSRCSHANPTPLPAPRPTLPLLLLWLAH
jgi:hypothetical protein